MDKTNGDDETGGFIKRITVTENKSILVSLSDIAVLEMYYNYVNEDLFTVDYGVLDRQLAKIHIVAVIRDFPDIMKHGNDDAIFLYVLLANLFKGLTQTLDVEKIKSSFQLRVRKTLLVDL